MPHNCLKLHPIFGHLANPLDSLAGRTRTAVERGKFVRCTSGSGLAPRGGGRPGGGGCGTGGRGGWVGFILRVVGNPLEETGRGGGGVGGGDPPTGLGGGGGGGVPPPQ